MATAAKLHTIGLALLVVGVVVGVAGYLVNRAVSALVVTGVILCLMGASLAWLLPVLTSRNESS